MCQSVYFNKVAGRESLAQVFSYEFWEISKNTFFYRTPLVAAFLLEYLQKIKIVKNYFYLDHSVAIWLKYGWNVF